MVFYFDLLEEEKSIWFHYKLEQLNSFTENSFQNSSFIFQNSFEIKISKHE